MWLVAPTKDCTCATCVTMRQFIDEAGVVRMDSGPQRCIGCGTLLELRFWDRPGSPPGNGYACPKCRPDGAR
jgi:hypothetical protein